MTFWGPSACRVVVTHYILLSSVLWVARRRQLRQIPSFLFCFPYPLAILHCCLLLLQILYFHCLLTSPKHDFETVCARSGSPLFRSSESLQESYEHGIDL